MPSISFSGGDALKAALAEISKKVEQTRTLRAGFLENATYPDGTSVAAVAAIQNFGAPAKKIPKRPYFSNMVGEKSPRWGEQIGKVVVAADYDVDVTMGRMGELIKSQLQQSIIETDGPRLSPITLMLRKMSSEDQGLVMGGKVVAEAARRVAEGESTDGVSTKVLDDTGHMLNSVDYEVSE